MTKLLFAALLLWAGLAVAQETGSGSGEVRKVDKAAGRITLRHGPIEAMNMPPMTMLFRAKDPAFFDKVKEGDKVRFTVAKEGGAFVLQTLEVEP
ncbi:MAG: copper-binding protein [Alphaproteobacteria bacterium]|nr:copper-binding protein [Alphaproteobacteria bacterium]